jgi:translation elongation factor EF-4
MEHHSLVKVTDHRPHRSHSRVRPYRLAAENKYAAACGLTTVAVTSLYLNINRSTARANAVKKHAVKHVAAMLVHRICRQVWQGGSVGYMCAATRNNATIHVTTSTISLLILD